MPNQKAIEAAKGYIGTLSAARQKAYAGLLKDDEALEELGQNVMLQADYTKKTQEAAEMRKSLEKEAEALKARRDELEAWREKANKKFDSSLKEQETLRTRLTEAEARMQTLAAKYQIPEEEIKLQMQATGQDAATAAAKVADQGGKAAQAGQGADMSQYLSQEMFQQESASLAVANAQVFDLMREHEKLFGEAVRAEDLIKGALQKGTSLRQYWEDQYKVADKRQEVAAQERADWERKIREEERAKIASEYEGQGLNPGTAAPRSGQGSPLLARFNRGDFDPFSAGNDGDGEGRSQRAAHVRDGSPSAIAAAVADFNSRLSASDAA